MNISAVVMASGLSRRMGENKLLIELFGKRIFEYTFDLLEQIDFDEVIIVSSFNELLTEAKARGFIGIRNENSEVGKSESIRLGASRAKTGNALMYFVADQPLLSKDTIDILIEAFLNKEAVTIPLSKDRKGNPVIFPSKYKDPLQTLKEDQGGMAVVKKEDIQFIDIDRSWEFIDVDDKEALERVVEEWKKKL